MNIGPGRSRIKLQPRHASLRCHGRRRPFRRPRNGKLPVFQIGERRVTIIRSDLARFMWARERRRTAPENQPKPQNSKPVAPTTASRRGRPSKGPRHRLPGHQVMNVPSAIGADYLARWLADPSGLGAGGCCHVATRLAADAVDWFDLIWCWLGTCPRR